MCLNKKSNIVIVKYLGNHIQRKLECSFLNEKIITYVTVVRMRQFTSVLYFIQLLKYNHKEREILSIICLPIAEI